MIHGLELTRFGCAYNDHVVLTDVNWRIAHGQVNVLYGASGAGKSTLLKAIAGWQNRMPSLRTWGTIAIDGRKASDRSLPVLVHQSTSLLQTSVGNQLAATLADRAALTAKAQRDLLLSQLAAFGLEALEAHWDIPVYLCEPDVQRALALALAILKNPSGLLIDEPMTGVEGAWCNRMSRALRSLAERRVVVMTSHNLHDVSRTEGVAFSLGIRRSDTPKDSQIISPVPDRASGFANRPLALRPVAPQGFVWIEPRLLGAMPRPGLLDELGRDLELLTQLGVKHIVCLEEVVPYAAAMAAIAEKAVAEKAVKPNAPHDAVSAKSENFVATAQSVIAPNNRAMVTHFPIVDMRAPTDEAALRRLVDFILARVAEREPVVVHCRGGLGRTGLVVACCYAKRFKLDAATSLAAVREFEPRFVQSAEQLEFVQRFCEG